MAGGKKRHVRADGRADGLTENFFAPIRQNKLAPLATLASRVIINWLYLCTTNFGLYMHPDEILVVQEKT